MEQNLIVLKGDKMNKNMTTYMTVVHDVKGMSIDEIKELTSGPSVKYMAWGHVPYERDDLLAQLQPKTSYEQEQI